MAIHSTSEASAAWQSLCEGLTELGDRIVGEDLLTPADRADGLTHLFQLLQLALHWHLDANDPDFPRFVHLNDTFELADNRFAAVRSGSEYVVRGNVGNLFDLNISLHEGWAFLGQAGVWGDLGIDDLDIGADGSFELLLGATSGRGRLEIPPEATMIQVREYYEDWDTHTPGFFEITRRSSEGCAPPRRDPGDVARRLAEVLPWIDGYLRAHGGMVGHLRAGPPNAVSPPSAHPAGNRNIQYGFGRFELDDGQALLLEFARPDARLWSVQWLTDPWYENPDLTNRATSVSGRYAHVGSDGIVRVVVSGSDPAVPNWLDVTGHSRGVLVVRWIWCRSGSDVSTRVVDIDDLRSALPPDTPTVTPADRRAEQARRARALRVPEAIGVATVPTPEGRTAASLVEAAQRDAGLGDFGPESFVEALDVLVDAMKREARLTPEGLEEQLGQCQRSLVTHLRAQDYFRHFPEILDEPIVAPVIIVGPQRTGTSKLFRLIAADPQWNVLYTWQALNLVPFGGSRPDGHDPRIDFAEDWCKQMAWLQPAHTVGARAPEMEALLLAGTFMVNAPTRIVPTHQAWCERADYTDVYRHLRKTLQFLQWQTHAEPGRRWILKSPTHLPNLRALAAVFPDATLVMTHRHPKTNVGSMLKLVELAQQRFATVVDRDAIRTAWLRILSLNVERFLEFRDDGHDDTFVDVGYPEVVSDALGAVERIYASAGAELTQDTFRAVTSSEREHPQHEGGAFTYSLADYDLTEGDVETAFATYIERFGAKF